MCRIYKGVQDKYAEGTRQICSVTSGEGVTALGFPLVVGTKEEETTV